MKHIHHIRYLYLFPPAQQPCVCLSRSASAAELPVPILMSIRLQWLSAGRSITLACLIVLTCTAATAMRLCSPLARPCPHEALNRLFLTPLALALKLRLLLGSDAASMFLPAACTASTFHIKPNCSCSHLVNPCFSRTFTTCAASLIVLPAACTASSCRTPPPGKGSSTGAVAAGGWGLRTWRGGWSANCSGWSGWMGG